MTSPFPFKTTVDIDNELKDATDYDLAQFARVEVPPANWGALNDDQRRSQRARNELALRRRLASEAAQQQDAAREVERKREATAQEAVEQFKQHARVAFPGSAAEFEQAWPEIKRQYQVQQSLNAMSAVERKAQSDIYTR